MSISALKELKTDMEKCFRCSLCKMVPLPAVKNPNFTDCCPASRVYHFHAFSGSGKQIMALSLIHGRIKADNDLAKAVFACTTCGYCDVACKFIMDAERHRINMRLREHLVEEGLSPKSHAEMMEKLRRMSNLQPTKNPWFDGLSVKKCATDKTNILLLAGCMTEINDAFSRSARKFAQILKKVGVDFFVDETENCCGLPAYWLGYKEDFATIAREKIAKFKNIGAKTVVVMSGSCYGALRSKYPEYAGEAGVNVLHATELLWDLVKSGNLKFKKIVNFKVTYHDPCYLGRQSEPFVKQESKEKITFGCMTYTEPVKKINFGVNGVYDPPRKLLENIFGLDFREMYRIREYSFCCGGGGGVPATFPEMGRASALHRIEEALDVGADYLVTACGHCEEHFRNAQGEDEKIKIVDIIDLIYEALGLGEDK